MRKICFIGAGGINSWAIDELNKLMNKLNIVEYMVTIYDEDIVEDKNILSQNQNYTVDDLMESKAESLAKKYGYFHFSKFITEENVNELEQYDDIILGVDNNKTRQLIYKFALEHKKYLLDLRAQGTQIAYFEIDHTKNMEYYNNLHFKNENVMERKGSCQLQRDIEENKIEMGNYIIATLGINACFLKHIRNEELTAKEFKMVY